MRVQPSRAATGGAPLFLNATSKSYQGPERRKHKRTPRTFGIIVEPLDLDDETTDRSIFAITRDISEGGLSFFSPFEADYEMALISLEEATSRGVVSRVCSSTLIHESQLESVYLTCVEFLYERFQ